MYAKIFEELGLSPNEAKIYETLIGTGETTVAEISVKGKIHRRNVYDALHRLIEKGLVFRIFQKGENAFRAVHPQKLLELVKEREAKLLKVLPGLTTLYDIEPPTEAAYIYKGVEGFKNYMRDLVRVGEETYFLGAKGLWFTPGIDKSFLTAFADTAKRKKFTYYTLFDPRVKEKMPDAAENVGGKYKFLPKAYATPAVCDIFGDYVVTFTSVDVGNFGEDGLIFVMINKQLAESYRTWFKFMWDACPEEK